MIFVILNFFFSNTTYFACFCFIRIIEQETIGDDSLCYSTKIHTYRPYHKSCDNKWDKSCLVKQKLIQNGWQDVSSYIFK